MRLREINELILYIKDMQAAVAFYRDTLGLSIAYPAGLPDYSNEHWVTFQTGNCTLALHGGASGEKGPQQPRFGFFVDDIHSVRSELISRGVDCGEVRTAAPGIYVCDCKDTEHNGFFIEQHDH
jgi:catechol 2,3-dioxygenase-like lactoylglutathione lyase family enzyme